MGIRGLDKETLQQANYDEKQIALLETYQVTDKDVKNFITTGKLKTQPLAYIDSDNDKLSANSTEAK